MTVTLDSIRTALQALKDNSTIIDVTDAQWDQISAATSEMLIACTIDPTTQNAIRGFLCGSYAALNHILNAPLVVGSTLPFTFIQTELALRWHDGIINTMSIADIIGLRDTLELETPSCDTQVTLPTRKRASGCVLKLGHDGYHKAIGTVNVDGRTYDYEVYA